MEKWYVVTKAVRDCYQGFRYSHSFRFTSKHQYVCQLKEKQAGNGPSRRHI